MKLVKKTLIGFVVAIALVFTLRSVASAKTYYTVPIATPLPTPIANVDSFDLFWPLAPGKTMADSLYSLKLLKEKISGFFIFGAPQKANYMVFLATKRSLEAEKLIKDAKPDLAGKTFDAMNSDLNSGYDLWQGTKSQQGAQGSTKDDLGTSLNKLETFLKYLSGKNQGDLKSKIDQGLDKVHQFQYSLSL